MILYILREKHQYSNKLKTINPKQNSAEFALALFILIMLLNQFIGGLIQSYNLTLGLLFSQLFFILLPALFLLKKEVVKSLIIPKESNQFVIILTVVLAAVPMYIIITFLYWLFVLFFSDSVIEAYEYNKLLDFENSDVFLILFLYAALPAICEELLFRGYFLSVFKKYGILAALLLPALMFGVFHPNYARILPVAVSGLWLGFLAIKTKTILLSIFAHFLHNLLVILMFNFSEDFSYLRIVYEDGQVKIYLVIVSAVVMFVLTKTLNNLNLQKN